MTLSTLELNILDCIPNNDVGLRGLEIAKKINRDIVFLYPVLNGLKKKGLIESYPRDCPKLKLIRKGLKPAYYRITKDGILELNNYLDALNSINYKIIPNPN